MDYIPITTNKQYIHICSTRFYKQGIKFIYRSIESVQHFNLSSIEHNLNTLEHILFFIAYLRLLKVKCHFLSSNFRVCICWPIQRWNEHRPTRPSLCYSFRAIHMVGIVCVKKQLACTIASLKWANITWPKTYCNRWIDHPTKGPGFKFKRLNLGGNHTWTHEKLHWTDGKLMGKPVVQCAGSKLHLKYSFER